MQYNKIKYNIYKPAKWLTYVDDTFVVWPHGPPKLQQFLHNLNSLRPTTKLTAKLKLIFITLPFLDVLVMKRGPKLVTKVYLNPTHISRYLHSKSNHQLQVKREVVHSLTSRAEVICADQKDFNKKIKDIIPDLVLNAYPQEFANSIKKSS
jgi:hypothetical protein